MTPLGSPLVLRFLGSPALVDACMDPRTPDLRAVLDAFVVEQGRTGDVLAVRDGLIAARSSASHPLAAVLEILARELPELSPAESDAYVAEAAGVGLRTLAMKLCGWTPAQPTAGPFAEIHCHLGAATTFAGRLSEVVAARSALKGSWREERWGQHPWPRLFDRLASQPDIDRADPASCAVPLPGGLELAFAVACAFRQRAMGSQASRGLEAFRERFDIWRHRPQARDSYEAAIRHFAAMDHDIVEWRPMLPPPEQVSAEVTALAHAYARVLSCDAKVPVIGLVYSLSRPDVARAPEQAIDESRAVALGWKERVTSLCRAIEAEPLLATFVLGIDCASAELGCPPRLFREACAAIHAFNDRVGCFGGKPGHPVERTQLESFRGRRPDCIVNLMGRWPTSLMHRGIGRLGITVHAGEDWDDPLTGLRHVDEVVSTCGLRRGDRIGHALVLGVEYDAVLERWADDRRLARVLRRGGAADGTAARYRALKPRGTHLLDLAWALAALGRATGRDVALWRATLRGQLAEATSRALGAPTDGAEMTGRVNAMNDHLGLRLPGLTFERRADVDPRHHEWCDVLPEEALNWFRELVLKRIRTIGVVIESCPTSNRLVADLGPNTKMPIERLVESGARVALASDDPGYFGSYVPDEAQLIRNGAVRAQVLQEARDAAWVWPV